MRLLLIASLLSLILFAGCFGPASPPPPEYKPPVVKNQTPSAPSVPAQVNRTPTKPTSPSTPAKNATAPKTNTTQKTNTTAPNVNTTAPKNATAPKTNTTSPAINTTQTTPAALPCNGLGTSDALDCLAKLAIEQKNVLVCTQLTAKDDRIKCFAQWCASGARDYRQCEKLSNVDDRLGCTMKCNPNFNT